MYRTNRTTLNVPPPRRNTLKSTVQTVVPTSGLVQSEAGDRNPSDQSKVRIVLFNTSPEKDVKFRFKGDQKQTGVVFLILTRLNSLRGAT